MYTGESEEKLQIYHILKKVTNYSVDTLTTFEKSFGTISGIPNLDLILFDF